MRDIFESHLTPATVKELWTSIYTPALPFTPQGFSIGSVLPAVFYMFRFGQRRGKGKFKETFGIQTLTARGHIIYSPPNIENVVDKLTSMNDLFEGFDTPTGRAILGDLLLTFCLENKGHQPGRTLQIQRAYPTHYMSSWIDLPENVVNLRGVPELITALLCNQEEGEVIDIRNQRRGHFQVACGIDKNLLLRLFAKGINTDGELSNLRGDKFNENTPVGIDELLSIRLAQMCGQAPNFAQGGDGSRQIPNQRPIAIKAEEFFRQDIKIFLRAYGDTIPRQTLIKMLESAIGLNLTNIYLSTVKMLLHWEDTGSLPSEDLQSPYGLFVDCSSGNDKRLRAYSEESMDEFLRVFERIAVVMMCLRILDNKTRNSRNIRNLLPPKSPDATGYINFLGSIFKKNHQHAEAILNAIDESCIAIAGDLENSEDNDARSVRAILEKEGNPVLRLAEAICKVMPRDIQMSQYLKALTSCLMPDSPNGLAMRRKRTKKISSQQTRGDAYSIVLSNTLLDFLVHRYLIKEARGIKTKSLSYLEFLNLLKERYGLYVNESPPGMSISSDYLMLNSQMLERRLRDLGLLIGVNDAESMKMMRQRYQAKDTNDYA
jgi:hypothetical protein